MKIGMIVVLLSLVIYVIFIFKQDIVSKKERKWVYLWVSLVVGLALLDMFHLSLSSFTTFLNVAFEGVSRLVVKL